MIAYIQGDLDGTCGIYAVINALRLIFKSMTELEAMRLLKEIFKCMEKRKKPSSIIVDGITDKDIRHIFKEVIEPRYPITWNRPFKKETPTIDKFWQEIFEFLKKGNHRSVIVSLENGDWDHWSVVHGITEKQILFFDSSELERVYRNRCSTKKATAKRPYLFTPCETFFISRIP